MKISNKLFIVFAILFFSCTKTKTTERYSNGQKKTEIEYTNGDNQYIERKYYEDGNLKSETECKNDIKDGVERSFYENQAVLEKMKRSVIEKDKLRDSIGKIS